MTKTRPPNIGTADSTIRPATHPYSASADALPDTAASSRLSRQTRAGALRKERAESGAAGLTELPQLPQLPQAPIQKHAANSLPNHPPEKQSHPGAFALSGKQARNSANDPPDDLPSRLPVNARSLRARNGLTSAVGAGFERRALNFLLRERLRLVARNVRCRDGELDLVMREPDGTLVFVEVRSRAHPQYGGAAASVDWRKRRRLVLAARHFLASSCLDELRANEFRANPVCACRFDVIAFEGWRLVWLRDAFRADDG